MLGHGVHPDEPLMMVGLDSRGGMELRRSLAESLGMQVSAAHEGWQRLVAGADGRHAWLAAPVPAASSTHRSRPNTPLPRPSRSCPSRCCTTTRAWLQW